MKILDILDKILKGSLAILFVFGCLQFLTLAVLALFGVYLDWQQYVSSIVLFTVGIVSIKFLIKMLPDGEETKEA